MSDSATFKQLGLSEPLLMTLSDLGYESPTPVQAQSIPILMNHQDLLAQAQTGTGKTAAFALPILHSLDLELQQPQALVIAPTRELAIQVAEAFQSYAKRLSDFHVTPIYGGQDYRIQLRSLKRGPHVIVGTPGRLLDHLRRGTLNVSKVKTVVLDEADEMLKMGFVEDITEILDNIPEEHLTALLSATMPAAIQKIAKRYLNNAEKVLIKPKKSHVEAISQSYVAVDNKQKLEVLRRLLEVENIEAVLIFVRTKVESTELAEKLQAAGFAAAALNGDMNQSKREKVVAALRRGDLDIVVATDVAARGIDVERITHVINYDIPCDTETYIHRIGRTGRAGRKGRALLFVTPRERRLFKDIEREIDADITQLEAPSVKDLTEKRSQQLAETISNVISKSKKLGPYHEMVAELISDAQHSPQEIAAALAYLLQQSNPLPEEEIFAPDMNKPVRVKKSRGRHPAQRRAAKRQQGRGGSKSTKSSTSAKKSSPKGGKKNKKRPKKS